MIPENIFKNQGKGQTGETGSTCNSLIDNLGCIRIYA